MRNLDSLIKELLRSGAKTLDDLASFKRRAAKAYKIPCPSNISLLKTYHTLVKNGRIKKSARIEKLLRVRPVRSLSGIVNVSVLTKPYPCPGECLYCPTQKGVPKSYLDNEPAVMRAILNQYDPYRQVKMRLRALTNTGHPTDKIELRIIGGTWSFYPKSYQTWFVKQCFQACNNKNSSSLEQQQKINEKAKHRIVGLSIETRPDYINQPEIKRLRVLGVTRVELGVQSIYDEVLKLNKRGHKVKSTVKATKLLKDAGFKICYQMMPNLPGSSLKKDEKMFEKLFEDSRFQPDLLKIYPCALLKESALYRWWQKKKYRPYTDRQLISLVKSIKKKIPFYVRIQRIARDIPSASIVAGPARISNLRQKVTGRCRCIRCREVKENYDPKEKLRLFRQEYPASNGREIFLSFENEKRIKLYSLLRLRITSQGSAIVREVHTYGQQLPIESSRLSLSPQHRGLGKKLMEQAEKIAKEEFGLEKIAVIAGVGVRAYYRKLGYQLKNTYMIKKI